MTSEPNVGRLTFDLDALRQAIEPLATRSRVAVAAYWAQYLVPSVEAYSEIFEMGDPSALQATLVLAWGAAAGLDVDLDVVAERQHQLVEEAPEFGWPPSVAFAAMEAYAAAWATLDVVLSGSIEWTVDSCRSVARVLDYYLDHREGIDGRDPQVDRLIWTPEEERLTKLVGSLAHTAPSIEEVRAIRASAEGPGKALAGRLVEFTHEMRELHRSPG